ncbi:hypothetical protein AJ79_01313 [Helicocarpus griseus UAMH5409]|uniref:Rhodopsin domain-containing protein n=1 Tax=Helicocarpus griseus UAMH5409 TaxID=1447875 RepID=A0A2B7Y7G3_9EURO|nr:hypothetical protein AJ79_01313 [Helicocarpus griseus UAMH5409]
MEGLSPEAENRGNSALAVAISLTALSIIFVSIRFYTRGRLVRKIAYDDWMCLVSLIFNIIFFGLFVGEWYYGIGVNKGNLSREAMRKQQIFLWITILAYNISLFCTKSSVTLLYHRIFPWTPIRRICYGFLTFFGLFGLWVILASILTCIPVQKFWNPRVEGKCLNMDPLWMSTAIVHIVTDVVLLTFPMPIISSMKLPKRQRFALMLVFALGGFVCVTSGLRLRSLRQAAHVHDDAWNNAALAAWSSVECNTALICCCLPTLRPLVTRISPRYCPAGSHNDTEEIKKGGPHLPSWFGQKGSQGSTGESQGSTRGVQESTEEPIGPTGQEHAGESYIHSVPRDEEDGGRLVMDLGGGTVATEPLALKPSHGDGSDKSGLIPSR